MGRAAANRAFLVGLSGLLLIASGCARTVSGSGNVTSTPVPVSPFSRLEVSNAFDVTARTLSSIDISGASQVHLSDVRSGERVGMVVSGAGRLDGDRPRGPGHA